MQVQIKPETIYPREWLKIIQKKKNFKLKAILLCNNFSHIEHQLDLKLKTCQDSTTNSIAENVAIIVFPYPGKIKPKCVGNSLEAYIKKRYRLLNDLEENSCSMLPPKTTTTITTTTTLTTDDVKIFNLFKGNIFNLKAQLLNYIIEYTNPNS